MSLLHLHFNSKSTSFANTFREDSDFASRRLYDLLHDCESQTKTLAVDLSSALKLSKASEELIHVFGSNPYSSVFDLDRQCAFWWSGTRILKSLI